jgi:hypothetical protein
VWSVARAPSLEYAGCGQAGVVKDEELRELHRQERATFRSVTTTKMTKEQADAAAQLIQKDFPGVYADPLDPRSFLSLRLDRWSAEVLREGLSRVAAAGGDAGNLLEEFDDFLAYGYPYEDDEERWPGIP